MFRAIAATLWSNQGHSSTKRWCIHKSPMIPTDIRTEWKMFRHNWSRQPVNDTKVQLQELSRHEKLVTMFSILNVLAIISLTIPVSTASVEQSFSQMKLIATKLRNCIGDSSLNHLILIAIESLDVATYR